MTADAIIVIAMFVVLIALLFTGFPVAYVLGGVGIAFTAVALVSNRVVGTEYDIDFQMLGLLINRVYKLLDNPILVAIPMFIFMGLMLEKSGIAETMMSAMQTLFGKLRGGLALTVTIIGVLLAASTGIIGASVVLLGLLSIPVMLQQGYSRAVSVGVVCSAGSLGILIPPSIMLVIMADQLSISVGDLFLGAVFPGLILAGLYAIFIVGLGIVRPGTFPLPKAAEDGLSWHGLWSVLKAVLPPLLLILLVLGSIFKGWATPTEASGVGAMGACLLAWTNGKWTPSVAHQVAQETLKTTAFIVAILVGATCFSLTLRLLGGDELIIEACHALELGPYALLGLLLLLVFLLGFVLDWIEITMIVLPIFGPIVSALGFELGGGNGVDYPELVWFGVLVAVTLQTSFLSPPVGFALFYLKGVCPPEIKVTDMYRGVVPFIGLQLVTLAIVLKFPQLVIWLPSVTYGGG